MDEYVSKPLKRPDLISSMTKAVRISQRKMHQALRGARADPLSIEYLVEKA
jgi:hypothetical protein